MRGRKPKPSHLRIIEGMAGHRPLNHDEPIPDGEITDPPAFLSARQQYYWRECVRNAPDGMLKPLDSGALTAYVIAYADLEYATLKVEEFGPVIKDPNVPAQFMRSPFVALKKQALADVLKAGAELGFSPSSRSRVKVTGRKKTKSALGTLRDLKLD